MNVASHIDFHEYQPCHEYLVEYGDGFMSCIISFRRFLYIIDFLFVCRINVYQF